MAVDNIARGMAAEALSGGGGGSSTLSGLTDVDISNPTNGQTLVYNATSGKWENGGGGSGGVTIVGIVFDNNTRTYTADMKAGEMYAAAQNSVLFLKEVNADAYYVVVQFFLDTGNYFFLTESGAGIVLEANSADDYPESDPIA